MRDIAYVGSDFRDTLRLALNTSCSSTPLFLIKNNEK
ncbi:MAG: hypothetical protein ACJAUP_002727 [Cellvibrionaceae bacterium]|jgi:hypothetical protein